jgi:hypothetical protein
LLYPLDLAGMGAIETRPAQGDLGIPDARIIVPGDPGRSLIYSRMSMLGPGRMPPRASSVVDQDAVKLVRDWIERLLARRTAARDTRASGPREGH